MRKPALRAAALAVALLLPLAAHCAEPVQHDSFFPPWQRGENNDAPQRGLSFTVPQVDDPADFPATPGKLLATLESLDV